MTNPTHVEALYEVLKAAVEDDLRQASYMLSEAELRIRNARHYVRSMLGDNSYAESMLSSVTLEGDIEAVESALIAVGNS